MALVEKFSNNYYSLERQGDYVLYRSFSGGSTTYLHYDFLARMLFISTGSSEGGRLAIPFSQLDPESLQFFHEQLVKLGGKPPALPGDEAAEPSETWVRLGDMAVAQVGVYPAVRRKLTHIFNLASRQMTAISENLKTGKEDSAAPIGFDDLPTATLEKALEEFTKAGGTADKNFVLRGVASLKK